MNKNYFSSYRGCTITARCSEVHNSSDLAELEALPSVWSTRFMASVSVQPADASEGWHQSPMDQFCTRDHAARNAMAVARHAIDDRLARREPLRDGSRRGGAR